MRGPHVRHSFGAATVLLMGLFCASQASELEPFLMAPNLVSVSPRCAARLDALAKCDVKLLGSAACSVRAFLDRKDVQQVLNCTEGSLADCQRNCLNGLGALGLPLSTEDPSCSVQDQLMSQYSGKPQLVLDFKQDPSTGFMTPVLLPSGLAGGSITPFIAYLGDYQRCMLGDGMQYCLVDATVEKSGMRLSALMGLCRPIECEGTEVHDAIAPLAGMIGFSGYTVDCHQPGAAEPALQLTWGKVAVLLLCLFLLALFGAGSLRACRAQRRQLQVLPRLPNADGQRSRLAGFAARLCEDWSLTRNLKSFWKVRPEDPEVSLTVLDGLRVVSTLWVILGHVVIWPMLSIQYENAAMLLPPKGRITELWFQVVPGGYFAVDTFFWLSGFLGARTLHSKVRRSPELLTAKGFSFQLFPTAVFARWLRLSLIYAFILVVSQTWYRDLGRGALLWNADMAGARMGCASSVDNDTCKKYWWANLLYINNMVPATTTTGCLAHTWYLACDMQLFLLVPLLVLLRERAGPIAGWVVLAMLTAASILANAWVLARDHLVSDPLFGNLGSGNFMQQVYEVSWMRAQPYLIGVGTAWVLEAARRRQTSAPASSGALTSGPTLLQSPPVTRVELGSVKAEFDTTGPTPLLAGLRLRDEAFLADPEESEAVAVSLHLSGQCWWLKPAAALLMQAISFILMTLVVMLPVTRYRCTSLLACASVDTSPWPEWLNIAYGALNHAVWGLGLAGLMLLCFLKAPGTWWVNRLLGNAMWQHPMKLTYTAYLLHPLVIVYFYCQSDVALHYLDTSIICNFVSFAMFVFLAAFILWVLVEKPCANLTARMLACSGAGSSSEH